MATSPTTPGPTPSIPPVPQCFVSPTAHLIIELPAPQASWNMQTAGMVIPWQSLAVLKQLLPVESADLVIVPLPQAAAIIRQLAQRAIRLRGYRG